MIIKCEYCGSNISDTFASCPKCGGTNKNMARSGRGVPKTIEELKTWCESKKMPLEKMRFFIGVNCKDPKCFGIYRDTYGNFIVYKNKTQRGERAIRYEGTDETYAVNEIYMKLKEEISKQAAAGNIKLNKYGEVSKVKFKNKRRRKRKSKTFQSVLGIFYILLMVAVLIITFYSIIGDKLERNQNNQAYSNGYYVGDSNYYYHSSAGSWYLFDDTTYQWNEEDEYFTGNDLSQSSYDEFLGDYSDDYSYESADDYYIYPSSNDDSWDSDDWDYDYDYDYGGWDSGITDWDSDW